MSFDEAVKILKRMYDNAPSDKRAISVHLFGIKYANDINGFSAHKIAKVALNKPSYGAEINKGKNLAEYVTIKENAITW